jgi:hypothetical protein
MKKDINLLSHREGLGEWLNENDLTGHGAEIGCARVQRTRARTLAEHRVAGRRTLRLLRAAREEYGAGE